MAIQINTLSHELFHGYQHEKGQGGTSIFNEVEAYTFATGVVLDKRGYGGSAFATSRNPNSPNANSFEQSANNLLHATTFSPTDFAKTVSLFKLQSVTNSTGLYNNYPMQRPNQMKSFLPRFYPLW